MSLSRRTWVWSLSALCALSATASAADDHRGVKVKIGDVTASTDGTLGGTRLDIRDRAAERAKREEAIRQGRSRNAQLLRSRVEVLQKVGALRRWQASSPRSEREQAAIEKAKETLRKQQQEQAKRAKERRKQQQQQDPKYKPQ